MPMNCSIQIKCTCHNCYHYYKVLTRLSPLSQNVFTIIKINCFHNRAYAIGVVNLNDQFDLKRMQN